MMHLAGQKLPEKTLMDAAAVDALHRIEWRLPGRAPRQELSAAARPTPSLPPSPIPIQVTPAMCRALTARKILRRHLPL
jgi:hypothetical protein